MNMSAKAKTLICLVSLMIATSLLTGTVLAVGPETNPNWATRAGNTPAGGSIGHINPAHPNMNLGEIYPGPDDCGFRNGEATKGSQKSLPDAVPFEQALPPT